MRDRGYIFIGHVSMGSSCLSIIEITKESKFFKISELPPIPEIDIIKDFKTKNKKYFNKKEKFKSSQVVNRRRIVKKRNRTKKNL